MKEKIIIIGAGGHAKVVIDIIELQSNYEIIGIIAQEDEKKKELFGYKIYKGDKYLLTFYNKGIKNIAIGIGGYKSNSLRKKIFNKVQKIGFNIPALIHPKAIVSSTAKIDDGSVIFAGVILNPEVQIRKNSIIATGSSIDHETIIEDHVLVSAGVTVGACTLIKEEVLVALGAKIISGVEIGSKALIASGAVVVNNINPETIVFGVPARSKS